MTTAPTDILPALRRRLAAALLVAALPVCAAATIRNTSHDLSASSIASVRAATDTEICKFCHTPHGAAATRLLWNHSPSTYAGSYSWGGQVTTTSGTTLPTSLKPATKACLACHDGTTAIGDLRNAGGGAAGVVPITDYSGTGRVSGGKMAAGNVNLVGAGGNMSGSHPVSIPYAGEKGYNGLDSAIPSANVDNAPGHYWRTSTAGCANNTGICTAANATGTNGSVIQLYDNTPGTRTNVGIECDSCHEPHGRFGYKWFMRVDAANSDGLCRSCHNK